MRACIISDTHNRLSKFDLPKADVLVHCGDWTLGGTYEEFRGFVKDLKSIRNRYEHIIVVPGNHDQIAETAPGVVVEALKNIKVVALIDKRVTIDGLNFFGSPWVPACGYWAFQFDDDAHAAAHWQKIPTNTDFLITHSSPHGILDLANSRWSVGHTGCPELAKRVVVVKPKVHAFGHIHEGYGMVSSAETDFINAASLKRDYVQQNTPVLIEVNNDRHS